MILAAWHCEKCDVGGRDPEPRCWNCDDDTVTVTARVSEEEPAQQMLVALTATYAAA